MGRRGIFLAALAVVALVGVGAVGNEISRINDVMLYGAPRFTDEELRSRPLLSERISMQQDVLKNIESILAAHGADTTKIEEINGNLDNYWWFPGDTVYMKEQLVDGMVPLRSDFRTQIPMVIPSDPEARDALSGDLAASVKDLGFSRGSGSGTCNGRPLFMAMDKWYSSIQVCVEPDYVDVSISTDLHLSSKAPIPPKTLSSK